MLLIALVFSLLILKINAQSTTVATMTASLTGNWPPLDTPPPFSQEWASLVDMTKVPNAPVVASTTDVGVKCDATDPYCNWSCTLCVNSTTDIIQCPNPSDWGITLDDGPTPYTPGVLDYLQSINQTITFFVIGSRVVNYPGTLQREVANGHQIGVHTWSHSYLTTQTNEEIIAEIKWTEAAIQQAVGLKPKYMRPPYGDVDNRVRSILYQLGYKIVIWDEDTNDWMTEDTTTPGFQASWIEGNFTEWVKQKNTTGHISLEHDLYNTSAAQVPKVIPIVKGAGFNVKPVYQCVGDTTFIQNNANATTIPTDVPAAPATS